MKYLLIIVLALTAAGCAVQAPPNLSPQAAAQWRGTKETQAIDLISKTAIEANETDPPLLSEATTRRILRSCKLMVTIIYTVQANSGAVVLTILDDLYEELTEAEKNIVGAYILLARNLLTGGKVTP